MSMQSFRDGVDPNWRGVWSSIVRIGESLICLVLLVTSLYHYNVGDINRTTLDLVLVAVIRIYSTQRRLSNE